MPTVTSDQLHALSRAVCAASGSIEHEATLVAVDERTWAEILAAAKMLGLADRQIDALIA